MSRSRQAGSGLRLSAVVGAWVRLLVNSAVVAAVAAAAQLGAGDALGIIRWTGPHDARAWSTLLTWVAFSYAVAVLAGAMVGRIAVRRQGHDGVGSRVTASVVAAGGAAAAISLAWLPARSLNPPNNVDPGLVISLTAGGGVVVGLVLALFALAARPVAVGLQAMASWVWLVGIVAAVAGLAGDEQLPAPRLGVPDVPSLLPDSAWTGPRAMIIAAAVAGSVVSGVARWRGSGRLGAALSGLGGPALTAAAYLVAGVGLAGAAQADPYWAAQIGAGAGLAASLLVALPTRRTAPARPKQRLVPAAAAPLTGDVVGGPEAGRGDVIEVARTPTTPAAAHGRARPAWAEASGAYARAYSGGGPTREPAAARGASWDADALAEATAAARDPQQAETGLYRSTSTPDADDGQPFSWLTELRGSGRHAAVD